MVLDVQTSPGKQHTSGRRAKAALARLLVEIDDEGPGNSRLALVPWGSEHGNEDIPLTLEERV